ncbi:MAG: carbamoyl-phosphate synthase large subunit [Euryarchaeota archaeon]|nr:carbamoyl-phosphate synthase large subunit [Euryarchaeota archaeon]
MPKREDIKTVMIIGSGPIQIGQAAEFDFSGSQACKSVREEGYRVILVNSNPATIQTDAEMADAVYVEPLTVESVEAIIAKERPDGILSGMGGQTALNVCSELAAAGVLDKYGVELLGTQLKAIEDSEDRDLFKKMMERIGEPVPKADVAHSVEEAKEVMQRLGLSFPVLIRPAYTLGGTGGGIAYHDDPDEGADRDSLTAIVRRGIAYSRTRQVLIEESVLGWKEYEYEVMRDSADNCITICNMENLDAMGVHTGESIVVAPAQTLSDADHQRLRTAALKIIRALKIEGGCNVQFAFDHDTGDYRVIEVNPRVSRSSALASKATGYPIARVAAKIAFGMTLDEIPNAITGKTFAAFEPTLDYVIMKIPRWPFDKFRSVDRRIGTQMKSTGEVMSIGRNIEEAVLKAVRSLEIDHDTLLAPDKWTDDQLREVMEKPTHKRLWVVVEALRRGWSHEDVHRHSDYDPFFLQKFQNIIDMERALAAEGKEIGTLDAEGRPTRDLDALQRSGASEAPGDLDPERLAAAKRMGMADAYIAKVSGLLETEVMDQRHRYGIRPVYKMVDTCAAEFEARTPYYYSTYEAVADGTDPEVAKGVRTDRTRKCVILGSGPIRIGQGVEFDYCCVHAAWALREAGIETVMINNNPETVSTDFDTSDTLYFEPLTLEDVMEIIEHEDPDGVLVQFGGQTAINLALPLERELARRPHLKAQIWGTPPSAIDLAEDRDKFNGLMRELNIPQPEGGTGTSAEEVKALAAKIGYPVLVRPSYVLGGRAMEIVGSEEQLMTYLDEAVRVSKSHPILVDRFLGNATEIDVDAVCDGEKVLVGAIMEHIEEAGVHSGDSTCTVPPPALPDDIQTTLKLYTKRVAKALGTQGLINIQYAVKEGKVYIIEANPRSSRTVPYVSKATGVPLAKIAARVAIGERLSDLDVPEPITDVYAVKAPVFPFLKLTGLDTILSPEMKSTGEVMGIDKDLGRAYWKAMEAAGNPLPGSGTAFVSVQAVDRDELLPVASQLVEMGFDLVATRGTAAYLREFDVPVETVYKVHERMAPDAIDLMRGGRIRLIINTASDTYEAPERRDGYQMRRVAVEMQIPFLATMAAARAGVHAIRSHKKGTGIEVESLQGHYGRTRGLKVEAKRVV